MTVLYAPHPNPPPQGQVLSTYTWERCLNAEMRFRPDFVARYGPGETGNVYVNPEDPGHALEQIFAAYNRGSGREVPFDGPSMSVEDLVHLGETTWRCASFGWEVRR